MYKYITAMIAISLISFGIWKFPRTEVVEVPVPVEDFRLYDDMAMLAMEVGDLSLAKKYIDKSEKQLLLAEYEKRKALTESVLELIDKGLSHKQVSVERVESVFDRLLAVESIDETPKGEHSVVVLLLLARMSAEQGFKGWDQIVRYLEKVSKDMESLDPELSTILYELSQQRIDE